MNIASIFLLTTAIGLSVLATPALLPAYAQQNPQESAAQAAPQPAGQVAARQPVPQIVSMPEQTGTGGQATVSVSPPVSTDQPASTESAGAPQTPTPSTGAQNLEYAPQLPSSQAVEQSVTVPQNSQAQTQDQPQQVIGTDEIGPPLVNPDDAQQQQQNGQLHTPNSWTGEDQEFYQPPSTDRPIPVPPQESQEMTPGGGTPDQVAPAVLPEGDTSSNGAYPNGVEPGGAPVAFDVTQNQTRIITASKKIRSIIVSDPRILTVTPLNANKFAVFGVNYGIASINVIDEYGNQIAHFSVTVTPSGYNAGSLAGMLPRGVSTSTAPNGAVSLNGTVDSPLEAYNANSTATKIVGQGNVLNNLSVNGSQQVMLKVKIAEISRDVTQELGINWQTLGQVGAEGLEIGSTGGVGDAAKFAATSVGNLTDPGSPGSYAFQGHNIDAILSALDEDNLAHMLAEPTLAALSGHTASFISGGSFPVPTPAGDGQVSITFQNYGVQLQFTPVVLSNGEIFLQVAPTVSSVSDQNAVTVPTGGSAIVVPSIVEQSANTTIVVGSGQTFAIAGLLQDTTTQSDQEVPGVSKLPIIGGAFRADNFSRNQVELVVLVTPYVVQPQDNPNAFSLPGNTWSPPNLVQRFFYGKQNAGPDQSHVYLPTDVGLELQ